MMAAFVLHLITKGPSSAHCLTVRGMLVQQMEAVLERCIQLSEGDAFGF